MLLGKVLFSERIFFVGRWYLDESVKFSQSDWICSLNEREEERGVNMFTW